MSKRILLVAATQAEMLEHTADHCTQLVTGVGMVATTFNLTQKLADQPFDLVVNIGIAGTFNHAMPIGSVVQVIADRFSDLGVEDNGKFIPADEMDLVATEELCFTTALRIALLPSAQGITVNRVHGHADTIAAVKAQFQPDVESMEGAAVAYVCQQFNIPWVQFRAISNIVEPRNRLSWNIPLALENLHAEVSNYIESLSE